MRLTDYAKKMGVCYQTAWRWFKDSKIHNAITTPTEKLIKELSEGRE